MSPRYDNGAGVVLAKRANPLAFRAAIAGRVSAARCALGQNRGIVLVITGPTGNVGAELVDVLRRQHNPVPWRIASRHADTPPEHGHDAVERSRLDFFDRTTWDATLAGATRLFLLFPLPGNRAARDAIIPFLLAAQDAGCQHVVYVSVFGAERGELFIPAGTGRTTFLDARDAAAVAALALLAPDAHRDAVHHLTGPSALSMEQVATALAAAGLGYPVTYTRPGLMAVARTRLDVTSPAADRRHDNVSVVNINR